jgi:YbbR domain-containing protein
MPITSYLVLNSQVNVLNVPDPYFARVTPNRISVLAIGPQPLLDAIEEDNDLVIVFVDLSGYTAGVYDVVLQVQMPLGLQVQMFPSEVQVELVEPQPVE